MPGSDSLLEPCAIFARTLVVSTLPPQRPVSPRRCRIKPTNEAVTTEAFQLERAALPPGGFARGRRVTYRIRASETHDAFFLLLIGNDEMKYGGIKNI